MRYPEIDPLALSLGPLQIHWYGLMYLGGFAFAWWFGVREARRNTNRFSPQSVSDLIVYCALGAIIGGRIGYMLFYNIEHVAANPLSILYLWQGGMSFHGGFIGVWVASILYARKLGLRHFEMTDFLVPLVPVGLGLGRLGNFINTELPGRITEVAWGLHYPCHALGEAAATCVPYAVDGFEQSTRHPSSLYQAFAEGVVLMAIMFFASRTNRPDGFLSGLFLLSYGCLRVITEFFRNPDAQIGFFFNGTATLGQLLSLPLIALSLVFFFLAYKQRLATTE